MRTLLVGLCWSRRCCRMKRQSLDPCRWRTRVRGYFCNWWLSLPSKERDVSTIGTHPPAKDRLAQLDLAAKLIASQSKVEFDQVRAITLVLQRRPVISKSSGVMGFAGGGLAMPAPA